MVFPKTKDKAKGAAESAGSAAHEVTSVTKTGIYGSREAAAKALERAAVGVRGGSKKASKVIDRYGSTMADSAETAATKLRPDRGRGGPVGYVRRHPMQTLILFGLVAGVIAVFWIRRSASRPYEAYEEPY
jgi:hypothetical protein